MSELKPSESPQGSSSSPPHEDSDSTRSHFHTQPEFLSSPFPAFFHPTRAEFIHHPAQQPSSEQGEEKPRSKWNSRASRKNRYTSKEVNVKHHWYEGERKRVGPPAEKSEETRREGHKLESDLVMVEQRLLHPTSRLKVHLSWDISFWVAVIFVVGSTCWIVNGFYLFLPLINIGGDHTTAAAWWAFAGGTWFELGSYLMLVESLNTGHDQLFGPALWGLFSSSSLSSKNEGNANGDGNLLSEKERGDQGRIIQQQTKFRWVGIGSWHDLGFLACFVQMIAATVFWVSTITGIPHVIPNLATSPPVAIADVFFWTPQVIGGTGFIISSTLLMLEVQTKWWKPNLQSLGWHIAVWNLVGAVGFTLCGALGYAAISSTKANYQSVLSTFWGSWAFEIGSVIQLWETLWREDPNTSDGSESAEN